MAGIRWLRLRQWHVPELPPLQFIAKLPLCHVCEITKVPPQLRSSVSPISAYNACSCRHSSAGSLIAKPFHAGNHYAISPERDQVIFKNDDCLGPSRHLGLVNKFPGH
jgi:hypothetical protein